MRCLVLNSPELRSALKGVYEGAATLKEAEWKALLGARRQLETAAARTHREWLREELAESGLPSWCQWIIIGRLKGRDFAPAELAAEIQSTHERLLDAAQSEAIKRPFLGDATGRGDG